MKTIIKTLLFTLLLSSCLQKTNKEIPVPSELSELSEAQKDQIERGYGLFIHFGVNTFNQIEWSDGSLPVSSYNPTDLDCDQWIKIAKEAGFRYVILVTKHHDGFGLWDSKYTNYDVGASPVKTDVVAEVAKACKKYGIKLGLYYSLWDRHEPTYKDSKKYNVFMQKQLTELLTNYGEVCELWFDGGWDKHPDEWDFPYISEYVKKMQPNCLITSNPSIGTPDMKQSTLPKDFKHGDPLWFYPVDFRIKDPYLARWDDPKYYSHHGKLHYLAFQHTLCLSDRWNWFQKKAVMPARSVDELEELFYWCTANNNVMIINMPPDQKGKIRTNEKVRILELADRLNIRGGEKPLPSGAINLSFDAEAIASSELEKEPAKMVNDFCLDTYWTAKDSVADIALKFKNQVTFNRVSLFEKATIEDLGDKFSKLRTYKVSEFELLYEINGKWYTFYTGKSIEACKIINLPYEIVADKIKLKILLSDGNPSICHIAVSKKSSKGLRTIKK